MDFEHKPVMPFEVIDGLNIKENGIYVDGTLGGGGHGELILKAAEGTRLIGIDKDIDAVNHCKNKFSEYGGRVTIVQDDFYNIKNILRELNVNKVDGALLDLGVSSFQLDNYERGFSYRAENFPLDMRMDRRQSLTAKDVVNGYSEKELIKILRDYGEEKFAASIARNIIRARAEKEISTCGELSEIIYKSIPAAARRTGGNPSKRTFQAIRIEVNGELKSLEAIENFIGALNKGGRLCVITFHSLEDRIVKLKFNELATGCVCPPKTPVCVCGHKAEIKKISNKPICASEKEKAENPRSASAKLRICEKL
jgi:16S rRNA (cytosine1402-N4)-methyltransferase